MAIDSEVLKKNCSNFSNSHEKAVDALRKANGKTHYTEIAKALEMPKTTVSGLLKKALKLGLAKKTSNGYYKKEPGILGDMPKSNTKKKAKKTVSDLIIRIKKKKKVKKPIPNTLHISATILNTLEPMSKAYMDLYVTENTLRELIRKVFSSEPDWWGNRVSSGFRKMVKETEKKTPYHAARRKDELEYTHLGQLKEIIISKRNWSFFTPYLKENNRDRFAFTIDRAIASRNAIGHCIPLNSEDLKVVGVRFSDILKMIK